MKPGNPAFCDPAPCDEGGLDVDISRFINLALQLRRAEEEDSASADGTLGSSAPKLQLVAAEAQACH